MYFEHHNPSGPTRPSSIILEKPEYFIIRRTCPEPVEGETKNYFTIMLLYLINSVILVDGSGERIYAKVIAEARTERLVPHPKAKANPATVN
jgi:hypothetical protein